LDKFKYIKFKDPKSESVSEPSRFEKAIFKILSTILPNANPDFENLIEQVDSWIVEYNLTENAAWREIGFNKNGHSIVAMPFGNNFGYWIDNHLKLEDFEAFGIIEISQDYFINEWTEFKRKIKK
jgi:hypothetical protein